MTTPSKTSDGRWVYCRFIRRNGRVIYPKNARFFRFWVANK
jgi:ribosomal protein L36